MEAIAVAPLSSPEKRVKIKVEIDVTHILNLKSLPPKTPLN